MDQVMWYVSAVGHENETEHSNGYEAYAKASKLIEDGFEPHIERVGCVTQVYSWGEMTETYA